MAHTASTLLIGAAMAAMVLAGQPAGAGLAPYGGLDLGWSSAPPIGPGAAGAEAAFAAATGASNPITFSGGSVPSDVSISVTNPFGPSAITNSPSAYCGFQFCGGDTDGNGWFLYVYEGGATFTFSKPIDSFGAYFSGIQVQDTIDFTDSRGAQTVNIPYGASGGMAFAGFTDFGQSITSVTVNAGLDIIGVDDVLVVSTVPEPTTWAMMLIGFVGLGFAAYRLARQPCQPREAEISAGCGLGVDGSELSRCAESDPSPVSL